MLQSVIGVTADGSVGPTTLSAAKAANPHTVVQTFSQHRLEYYRSLEGWRILVRAGQIERTALSKPR
jgi:lysozyme family protein